jgi:hypothetical protein
MSKFGFIPCAVKRTQSSMRISDIPL